MPWKTRKAKGGGFDILRQDTGEKVGHSDTEAKAKASVRARYAGHRSGGRKFLKP